MQAKQEGPRYIVGQVLMNAPIYSMIELLKDGSEVVPKDFSTRLP